MNNQVMLEALEAQLIVKQNEVDTYRKEVYDPQSQELEKSTVDNLNALLCPDLNLIKHVQINSDSMGISINETNRYGTTINFLTRGWNDENRQYEFTWYSGGTSSNLSDNDRNYGILIGRISEKFDPALAIVKDDVLPKYRKILEGLNSVNRSLRDLEASIRQLKETIDSDNKAKYYKPGFQLKLKEYKELEWATIDEDTNNRQLVNRPGTAKLIDGRSKYDYSFVIEFKVIGKKGYKYVLETRTHSRPEMVNEVEVTPMRFQEFIDNVYLWETREADAKTKRAEERYAEFVSRKESTTLPTIKL